MQNFQTAMVYSKTLCVHVSHLLELTAQKTRLKLVNYVSGSMQQGKSFFYQKMADSNFNKTRSSVLLKNLNVFSKDVKKPSAGSSCI